MQYSFYNMVPGLGLLLAHLCYHNAFFPGWCPSSLTQWSGFTSLMTTNWLFKKSQVDMTVTVHNRCKRSFESGPHAFLFSVGARAAPQLAGCVFIHKTFIFGKGGVGGLAPDCCLETHGCFSSEQ